MEKHAKSASLQWRWVSVAAWVIPAANIIQHFIWRRGKSNFHAFGHWEHNQPGVRNTQHVRCLSHTCHWLLRRLQHSSSKTSAVNHQVWDTAWHLTSPSAKREKKKRCTKALHVGVGWGVSRPWWMKDQVATWWSSLILSASGLTWPGVIRSGPSTPPVSKLTRRDFFLSTPNNGESCHQMMKWVNLMITCDCFCKEQTRPGMWAGWKKAAESSDNKIIPACLIFYFFFQGVVVVVLTIIMKILSHSDGIWIAAEHPDWT